MSLVLAKKGCKLVIWDINTDAAQKVGACWRLGAVLSGDVADASSRRRHAAQEIQRAGGSASAYHCNVMDNESVREVAAKVQSEVPKACCPFVCSCTDPNH